MNRALAGAIAGTVATFAMTLAMAQTKKRLPRRERYPLPAGEIAYEIARRATSSRTWPRSGRSELAATAHFAFGAAAGAGYGLARRPGPITGAGYGALVWAASYFGWVPGFRILTPADRHPPRRTALMVGAHLVWGGVLGYAARRLQETESVFLDEGSGVRTPPDRAGLD